MASLVFIGYAALALLAGGWDLARLRIPNALVLAVAGLFVAAAALLPVSVDWASHGGAALIAGAGGAVPFACHRMGGGDVKFLAALSLWAGLDMLVPLLTVTALTGGVLALALVAVRAGACRWALAAGAEAALPALLRPGGPVPYGVAIAAGGLLTGPDFPLFTAVSL